MYSKTKKAFKFQFVALILLSMLFVIPNGKVKAGADGTYKQDEARAMLEYINEFRHGSEAWYWNESDTEKVYCSGLGDLTYDYELEKVAMLRAKEIAQSFSHTRPNGQSCWTAYDDCGYDWQWSVGENIAYGQTSAYEVYMDWREDNDPYAGQGHRRNMLGSGFKAIGIGCYEYNGRKYWVQEFTGNTPTGSALINPDITETPDPTTTPDPTPEVTDTPEVTPDPTPIVTTTPDPTPVVTATPEVTATATPEVTTTPDPTPVIVTTPEPTPVIVTTTPDPTNVVVVVVTGEDVVITFGPNPTTTPVPTQSPVVTTPAPTQTPAPTANPNVSVSTSVNVSTSSDGTTKETSFQKVNGEINISVKSTTSDEKVDEAQYSGISGKKIALDSLTTYKKTLTIPKTVKANGKSYTVTTISSDILEGNNTVTKLKIGSKIESIEEDAFNGKKKIKNIQITAGSLKYVGDGAFAGINSKAKITIKGTKKQFEAIKQMIIDSGVGKKVKFIHKS
jgi:uncharacterized protein YkwD